MAAAAEHDLILFVAGEPDSGVGSLQDSGASFFGRLGGGFAPATMYLGMHEKAAPVGETPPPSTAQQRAWHLPPGQVDCVNMVLDLAERAGRKVTVIDVNRPLEHEELVHRWVRSDDLLPMLVRSDGPRLMGLEKFVPRKVRQFIDRR
jgi:hypothetical protein